MVFVMRSFCLWLVVNVPSVWNVYCDVAITVRSAFWSVFGGKCCCCGKRDRLTNGECYICAVVWEQAIRNADWDGSYCYDSDLFGPTDAELASWAS